MEIDDILQDVRKEVEADDAVRETILPLARSAVREFSQSIKASHRSEYDLARKHIEEGKMMIEKASDAMEKSDFLSKSRILDTAYQELAEAVNVHSILSKGVFTPPEKHEIPSRAYLTGLADTIGELRRAILNLLRQDDTESGEILLHMMEDILEELHTFDFPNALVPDLRRKCDVGRGIIERTRGDLTTAVRQNRLIRELRDFEDKIGGK